MKDGTSFVWMWDKETRQLLELWHFPRRSQLYEVFRRKNMFDHGLAFSIGDVRPLLGALKRTGGKWLRDINLGEARLTLVRDPDGHIIEILSWTNSKKHTKSPFLDLALFPKDG